MNHALWFASRATGLVCLPLLTLSLLFGVRGAGRAASARWPRFTVAALHRNVSLLCVVFLAVHVASAIIDPYAGIGWLDAVAPFGSVYHPFWLGLGAVAVDLLLALIVTSLLRTRISPPVWRTVHWTAYLCWPVAVLHGLGIGGRDTRLSWVIGLNVGCAVVVLIAVAVRLRGPNHPDPLTRRAVAAGERPLTAGRR